MLTFLAWHIQLTTNVAFYHISKCTSTLWSSLILCPEFASNNRNLETQIQISQTHFVSHSTPLLFDACSIGLFLFARLIWLSIAILTQFMNPHNSCLTFRLSFDPAFLGILSNPSQKLRQIQKNATQFHTKHTICDKKYRQNQVIQNRGLVKIARSTSM